MILKIETREKYFKELGLGEYNKDNILKLQKKYFTNPKEWDGVYGVKTDILLKHVYNIFKYTKNFRPEEFRCGCGGRFCTGYPDYLKKNEAKHLQTIRDHYKAPVQITSGLRCEIFNNSLRGSSKNSGHLKGKAADIYIRDKCNSLNNRKRIIEYIKNLPKHKWSYCNGYSSAGTTPYAPGMGRAIHTETE